MCRRLRRRVAAPVLTSDFIRYATAPIPAAPQAAACPHAPPSRSHKAHTPAAMPRSTQREEEVGQGHCPSVRPGVLAATQRPAGSPAQQQLRAWRPARHARRGGGGGGCKAEGGGAVAPQRDLRLTRGGWVGACVHTGAGHGHARPHRSACASAVTLCSAHYASAVLDNFQLVAQQNIRHLCWLGAWATLDRHLRDAPSLLRRVIMVPPRSCDRLVALCA